MNWTKAKKSPTHPKNLLPHETMNNFKVIINLHFVIIFKTFADEQLVLMKQFSWINNTLK